MMTKMFTSNPSDPVSSACSKDYEYCLLIMLCLFIQVEFMQQYLRDNHGHRPAYNVNLRMELDFLRDQVAKLSQSGAATSGQESSTADEAGAGSDSSEDSEGEEEVYDLPLEEVKKKQQGRGPRASVSAEAFGNWNKKEEFKAPFYEKSPELVGALRSRLS